MQFRAPRLLWLTILTVLLAVVVVGLRFGLPVYRRHEVLEEIKRRGGLVATYKCGPEWLRRLIGEEFAAEYGSPYLIDFWELGRQYPPAPKDLDMRHLAALEDLEHLDLRGMSVTDADLTHLRRL